MTEVKSIREIEKILRTSIIENSGVNANFVRNVITEFSVDLDKDYTSSIFSGLSEEDAVILFELVPDDNNSDMSEDIHNSNNIAYYKYFKLKVIVYGDDAVSVSMRVISRLRSQAVRDTLIGQGINISNISETNEINEIINGIVWQRSDFNINIGCKLIIEPVKENYEINEYNNLVVYNK